MSQFDFNAASPSDPGQATEFAIGGSYIQAGLQDPSVTATIGPKGALFIRGGVGGGPIGVWQKQDDGLSTNWTVFGSGGGGSDPFVREDFVLTAPDIANGYVDLSQIAKHPSVIANLEGAALLIKDTDYTLSDAGVTRITFDPSLVALLGVGQKLQVQFN